MKKQQDSFPRKPAGMRSANKVHGQSRRTSDTSEPHVSKKPGSGSRRQESKERHVHLHRSAQSHPDLDMWDPAPRPPHDPAARFPSNRLPASSSVPSRPLSFHFRAPVPPRTTQPTSTSLARASALQDAADTPRLPQLAQKASRQQTSQQRSQQRQRHRVAKQELFWQLETERREGTVGPATLARWEKMSQVGIRAESGSGNGPGSGNGSRSSGADFEDGKMVDGNTRQRTARHDGPDGYANHVLSYPQPKKAPPKQDRGVGRSTSWT